MEKALVKVKSKLPQIVQYAPDTHFDYLSGGKPLIPVQRVRDLLLFRNEYEDFNPIDHLGSLLANLN